MKINNKKFKQSVEEYVTRNKEELDKHRIEDLNFSYVNIKKNRNREDYDITVSVDDMEVSLMLIRDIIEEVCLELNINVRKIIVEI